MPQIMKGIKSYKMAADKSNGNRITATAFSGDQQPGKYTISPNQYSRKPTTVATPCCMRNRVKKTQRKSCSEKKKMHLSDPLFIDPIRKRTFSATFKSLFIVIDFYPSLSNIVFLFKANAMLMNKKFSKSILILKTNF